MRDGIQTDHEFEPSPFCDCSDCNQLCHYHYGREDACILERQMHKPAAAPTPVEPSIGEHKFVLNRCVYCGSGPEREYRGTSCVCVPAAQPAKGASIPKRWQDKHRDADTIFGKKGWFVRQLIEEIGTAEERIGRDEERIAKLELGLEGIANCGDRMGHIMKHIARAALAASSGVTK